MVYSCSFMRAIDMKADFTSDNGNGKTIEFNLALHVDICNWTQDPDSATLQFQEDEPTSTRTTTAAAAAGESLKLDNIQAVVDAAFNDCVCEYCVPADERCIVAARAWKEASKIFEADKTASGLLKLNCTMAMRHEHVYYHIPTDYPPMVPASDLSLGMLEKCEVDGDAGGCCICLEDIAGGGSLRMPCSHVFHGDCIEEWLRTSHYCPLCRYEMPTQ